MSLRGLSAYPGHTRARTLSSAQINLNKNKNKNKNFPFGMPFPHGGIWEGG